MPACTRRPSEDTVSRRLSESKDRSFWRNQPCWLLELGFPASRAVINKPLSLVFCDGSPSRLIQGSYKISPGFKFPICISDGVRNLFCYRVVGWEMTECNQHSASVDAISYMKQLVPTRTGEHSFSNSPGFLQSTQHNNKTTPITTHGSFGFPSTFCRADILLKTQTYSTGAVFLVPSTGYLSFKSLLNSLYILVLFYLLYLKDSKHKSGKFQTNAHWPRTWNCMY